MIDRKDPSYRLGLSFFATARSRTPGASRFVNSTPADSKARRNAVTVELWAPRTPGATSRRLIVGSDTPEAIAKSRCSHRNRARAARINSLVIASESNLSGIDEVTPETMIETLGIDSRNFGA